MNFSQCGGKVPVFVGGDSPYKLVDFPSKPQFKRLYESFKPELIEKYWVMMNMRAEGKTLAEVGTRYNVSRERVRQIEAKFLKRLAVSLIPETL